MIAALAVVLLLALVPVTSHGRIGTLQLDRSTRADVVALMGPPEVEAHIYGYFEKADRLDALGYHCGRRYGPDAMALVRGGPRCLDVFWIDVRTGKLGNAYLVDRRFVGPHGIRPGTASATVERILHQRLNGGCVDELREGEVTYVFSGGHRVRIPGNLAHLVGAHVSALVLDGHQNTGLFECI